MQPELKIEAEWEHLDEGSDEERAGFAALAIRHGTQTLTEGRDSFVNRLRPGPLVSAYHLAEWLAWNWWRLRWEPRSDAADWAFAHHMTTIGAGYVWPNITIFSDGEQTTLIAKPTTDRPETVFRYISDLVVVVPSAAFEIEIDRFVTQVLGQLRAERVADTNLERLWAELIVERRDRETARRRKLEALLGEEPDAADPAVIDRLVDEARELGSRAVEELAADRRLGSRPPTIDELRQHADSAAGFASSPRDAARLAVGDIGVGPDVPAWKLGAEAAGRLRQQEGLGDDQPIDNQRLAALAGTVCDALTETPTRSNLSFSLDRDNAESRIVLRPRRATGRRFELARLLADQVVMPPVGRLHAATRAYTYRQKMQRSFAAELLSPFKAVEAMLDGDYSADAQGDAAAYFMVSDLTISTLLVNHRAIGRDEFDEAALATG